MFAAKRARPPLALLLLALAPLLLAADGSDPWVAANSALTIVVVTLGAFASVAGLILRLTAKQARLEQTVSHQGSAMEGHVQRIEAASDATKGRMTETLSEAIRGLHTGMDALGTQIREVKAAVGSRVGTDVCFARHQGIDQAIGALRERGDHAIGALRLQMEQGDRALSGRIKRLEAVNGPTVDDSQEAPLPVMTPGGGR